MPALPFPTKDSQGRTSLLADLLQYHPQVRSQVYFKSSLVALSHALEDLVLSEPGEALVLANFQQERFYRQETARYDRIAKTAQDVYVLAAPDTNFHAVEVPYERVALDPEDPLANEWHLIIVDQQFAACLICAEKTLPAAMDAVRQFEGYWTFDREFTVQAAELLLDKIGIYRPELADSIETTKTRIQQNSSSPRPERHGQDPFAQRLMMYLQAGQYKLQRAYKSIKQKERRERSINRIVAAVRRSLDVADIFSEAVQELGQGLDACRCVLYRWEGDRPSVEIESEFIRDGMPSLLGQTWPAGENPFLRQALERGESSQVSDTPLEALNPKLRIMWERGMIRGWLAVPIQYKGETLGVIELHRCDSVTTSKATQSGTVTTSWADVDVELVESVAIQIGVALIQAQAYENLNDLNAQLEELDQAKSDLIAVTGHELRTPLSTIQVCLESLASEPDMAPEIREVMLDTAIQDAERLRTLVQDFLTLSRLESGRVDWHLEPLTPQECIDLALSSITSRSEAPPIKTAVPKDLPMVNADGEWLVEVLRKLLDNACKFTPQTGTVTVSAEQVSDTEVQFSIMDNGRGIETDRLQQIFERFYQAEGSLRRTVGGTGLGLAISRQIVESLGGKIWVESAGTDQGSTFHFTIPIAP